MKPNPKLIAIGSILAISLTLGTYSALSVYMPSISEKFQVDLSKVALIFTMCSICGLITSLFLGNLLKTLGIKKFIILEGIAIIIFFMTISFSNSIIVLYIGAFLFGTVNGGFGACQTEISVWFSKGQGTLISLLSVGMGITAVILSPLLSKLLITYDIAKISMIHGLLLGIIVIFIGFFMMAEPPAHYNMTPVGYTPDTENNGVSGSQLTVGKIIKLPAFWLIIIAGGLFNFINGGIVSNAAVIYQSIGADTMQASLCISVYNGVLLAFSPLFGTIADKKGPKLGTFIIGISTICGAVAAIFLQGMTGALVTAVFISACGVCGSLATVSLVKVFQGAEAGSLIGYAMTFGAVGQMIAAPLAANIYVATGSFKPFMIVAIAAAVVVILCMTAATGKKSMEKINQAAK